MGETEVYRRNLPKPGGLTSDVVLQEDLYKHGKVAILARSPNAKLVSFALPKHPICLGNTLTRRYAPRIRDTTLLPRGTPGLVRWWSKVHSWIHSEQSLRAKRRRGLATGTRYSGFGSGRINPLTRTWWDRYKCGLPACHSPVKSLTPVYTAPPFSAYDVQWPCSRKSS